MKKFGIIVVVVLVIIGGVMVKQGQELKTVIKQTDKITKVNVRDGIYQGQANTLLVKVSVEVSVKGNEIVDIQLLKHDNGLGKKAEVIVSDIIEKQDLEVDNVSGATVSSELIKAAVKNALMEGSNE